MIKCTKGQVRRLKTALRWKIPPEQRQRIQMVLLRESGMTQSLIAAAMGVSLSTVNRAHMAYDHGGVEALKPRPSGGRKRENMTLEEEKALPARFAKAAEAGEMLNIHDLKAACEKVIGHETSKSTSQWHRMRGPREILSWRRILGRRERGRPDGRARPHDQRQLRRIYPRAGFQRRIDKVGLAVGLACGDS
jgi:transposase